MTSNVATSSPTFVVTGASGGVGRAVAERLAVTGIVVNLDPTPARVDHHRILHVEGDGRDHRAAVAAAKLAEDHGPLTGWVNNAAVFRDAAILDDSADHISALVSQNLDLAIVGCHTAVRHFVAHARHGAIVNVSSHQAQRAVRGALPYATAKAAVEGLTRAAAVDHGPQGIRVNAVALGSIATARYEQYRVRHPDVEEQMSRLHPLGHIGQPTDVANVVAFLLSSDAGFITGAVLPVDGGRAALGLDPESADGG